MQWNEFRSHIGHFSARQQQRVREAFELGKRMHVEQTRRSGEPYFSHPVAVATMLAGMGADPDTIIAALLHDTVEDTPLTLREIETLFGSSAGTLIEGMTKLNAADVAEKPNLNEQIETLRKIFTLMERDVRIMVIKLVDRLHNMQTTEFLQPDRQQIVAQETRDVYVKIADRLCMQDLRDELKGLALAILNPEEFAKLSALRTQNEARGEEVFHSMQQRILTEHPAALQQISMRYEHKAWEKIREQLQNEGMVITGISAVTAVFVCPNIDDCYRMLGILHQLWKRESLSFQDFINAPAVNGYRGLHTTVILEDGTRVRCKIRTTGMQEYARKGIALRCFEGKPEGLLEYLPWTAHISPLAQDTEGRSTEFWQSLQSDILGESIVIYGPGDQSVTVSAGSTALDGAFALFREEALNISSISIGGKAVTFHTPLQQATSLNVVFGDTPKATREWLTWVKTGLASAIIRRALVEGRSEAERAELGKSLLQEIMSEKKRGFIDEFSKHDLEQKLQILGYASLDQAYVAVADGRLEPDRLYEQLFEATRARATVPFQTHVIQYTVNMNDVDAMDRLNAVHRRYGDALDDIRYTRQRDGHRAIVRIRAHLTPNELADLKQQLTLSGVQSLDVHPATTQRQIALAIGVILLWSLNPVFAQWLLLNGIPFMSLITVRFLTFSVFTMAFFILWRWYTKAPLKRIPRITLIAVQPAVANAALSIGTYLALTFVPPSLHLTLLRFNPFLIPVLRGKFQWRETLTVCAILALLVGLSVTLLRSPSNITMIGIGISLATLLLYTMYSLSMQRALQQHMIDVRYPYLLLRIGILLGVAGGVLLFLQPDILQHPLLWISVAYVFFCVCIPHTLYSALLKTAHFRHVTDVFLLEVPIAMVLEGLILGTILPVWLYVGIALVLLTLLSLRWQQIHAALPAGET